MIAPSLRHNSAHALLALLSLALTSCSVHEIKTAEEWCQQLSGIDLMEKNAPFWSVFPGITFNGDAIRDDFVTSLNLPLLEKVQRRTDRMVWREGTTLHLENLSTLMDIEPHVVISGWQEGIERGRTYRTEDDADLCLYGSTTSLFDQVVIHSGEWDALGLNVIKDRLTTIDTDRRARLKNPI